jgi:hypothetical protein
MSLQCETPEIFDRHDDRRQDQQSPKIVGNTPLHYDPATHVKDTAVPRKRSSSDPGLWLGKQCDHRLGKPTLPQTTHYKCLTTQAYAVESVDHTTFLSHPKRAVLLHTPVPTPSEFSDADNLSASDVDEIIQAMMDDGSVRDTLDVHRELREKVFSDTSNIGLQCKEVVHKKGVGNVEATDRLLTHRRKYPHKKKNETEASRENLGPIRKLTFPGCAPITNNKPPIRLWNSTLFVTTVN